MDWLTYRGGPETIVHFCLSLSDQLCCEIMLVYIWVHINSRPNCVILHNLSWPSILQDTTINHTYGCNILFKKKSNTDLISTAKDSQRCMLSYHLTREWTWHYFYPIWPYPGFSMIFQDEYLISSMINSFPVPPLYWVVFIGPSLPQ